MGFFYKHLIQPLLSKSLGKKSFTNNPYLGMCIEADESNLIADEQFRIGIAYQNGAYMLPQDNKKALEYYRKAAERGHAVEQLFMVMGTMRYNDDHNDEVMYWLQKAASQGERQAMYNLAISYHRGDIGGKPDIARSTELLRRSAEKGYGAACSRYAILFLNGEDGVDKNYAVAKFWALEAYGFGDEQDGEVLKHIMSEEDFVDGKIQILVSTTVVEVGVNVPNASLMVIENAERFGLAQLHQLRGRVGRGKTESFCVLVSDQKQTSTRKRLKVLVDSTDGFYIAEEDLRLRGSGDVFGLRQHGFPQFKAADLYRDMDLLRQAQQLSRTVMELDPSLNQLEHRGIRQELERFWENAVITQAGTG